MLFVRLKKVCGNCKYVKKDFNRDILNKAKKTPIAAELCADEGVAKHSKS